MDEQSVRIFYEKELQKINQKELRIEKIIKKKGNKLLSYMSIGKDMIIYFIVGLIKKTLIESILSTI